MKINVFDSNNKEWLKFDILTVLQNEEETVIVGYKQSDRMFLSFGIKLNDNNQIVFYKINDELQHFYKKLVDGEIGKDFDLRTFYREHRWLPRRFKKVEPNQTYSMLKYFSEKPFVLENKLENKKLLVNN